MELSKEALDKLKSLEGFCPHIYYDVAGNATIGYGHQLTDQDSMQCVSKQGAEELLLQDVSDACESVNDFVKIDLYQNQFDCLVLFCYNVGRLAFANSTLLKCLNSGNREAVPEQLKRWVNAGGQRIEGLVRRRNAEIALWKGE